MKPPIPDGVTALRSFANFLDGQAARHERLQRRRAGTISTTVETFRTAASHARQEATRLERVAQQQKGGAR